MAASSRLASVGKHHADLYPLNILVSDRAHVIDWAWACRGAAWVDPAFLVIRLIAAGHSPASAEDWMNQVPSWLEASELARTAFAVAVSGMWEYRGRRNPARSVGPTTASARTWARYRIANSAG